jgi:DNA-binding PadR family transcriptional regulator
MPSRSRPEPLGEFEQLVLLAVLRLGTQAYAVPVRAEIQERTRRLTSRGAVYITLDRLEEKGFLRSHLGDASEQRGGRQRRYYRLTPAGEKTLEQSWHVFRSMWEGLEPKARRT